jgi:hypothetical protein
MLIPTSIAPSDKEHEANLLFGPHSAREGAGWVAAVHPRSCFSFISHFFLIFSLQSQPA